MPGKIEKKLKSSKRPLVCIIIVNWNGQKITKDCITSLLSLTKYNNFKVLIIDNGSTDGSIKEISDLKNVELIKLKENIGYAPAINLGWRYCLDKYNPDYLCNLNNDTVILQSSWLDLMIDELEKDPKNGICGNRIIFPDGTVQILYTPFNKQEYESDKLVNYKLLKEVKSISGVNMLVKRSVVDKIKGLDEHFFYGADDLDYCLRARKTGYKMIYQGLSDIIHLGSLSYRAANKDFIYKHQSYCQILFNLRHGTTKEKWTMPILQFARSFFTRNVSYEKRTIKNTTFHITFIRRIFYFFGSLFRALKDYKNIKLDNFNDKITEPKDI